MLNELSQFVNVASKPFNATKELSVIGLVWDGKHEIKSFCERLLCAIIVTFFEQVF